jgi:endonuclease/exonuclease/phosphatase family metal-dependent hydrolase
MKKRIFSVFAFLLTAFLLTLAFAGCDGEGNGGETDTVSPESLADTETQAPDPMSGYLPLTENGKPLYAVAYQASDFVAGVTSTDAYETALSITAKLNSLLPDASFKTVSSSRIPEGMKVIAVGKVAGVSDSYFEDLRFRDWRLDENNGNISVAGYIHSAFYIASERVKDAVKLIDGELYLKKEVLGTSFHDSYSIQSLTVNGKSAFDYEISYTGNNLDLAEILRDKIRVVSGVILPVVENGTAEKQIVIECSPEATGYRVACEGDTLVISYADTLDRELLEMNLERTLSSVTSGGSLVWKDVEKNYSLMGGRRLITFNVLNVWNGANPGSRDDATVRMIKAYMPDFICLQEFDIGYRNASNGLISQLSEDYAEVTLSGVEQNYVWNPIFYNKDRYTVLESGFVYLPDHTTSNESKNYQATPDKTSRFRSLVWAVLKDKTTNEVFVIGNLHFSVTDGAAVQGGEATVVINTIKGVAARYEGCTTLVAGDYNSNRQSSTMGIGTMLSKGFYDTYDSAYHRNDYATTHGTGKVPSTGYLKNAIDHVLSLERLDVQAYLVLVDEEILPASDHCPTVIQFN